MLKAGDRVRIDGTIVVRVAVAGGHETRTYAHESLHLVPTMGEVSKFVDH